MIRLTIPVIDDDDIRAVNEVLRSGFLVQGPGVAEFERQVAEYVGVEHAVAVSNCTAGLHLSLLALGVGPGDQVAVTTYSWPATANVIALCGAEPVFIDIDPATYNMHPGRLSEVLTEKRVSAILPVHAFGGMADMHRILEVAGLYGTPVVEDAACALGSDLQGRRAGTWGQLACFSFHPRKAITTGEGGIVTTDDPALARTLRVLRNHGLDPDSPVPDFVAAGYNLRMTEFQAALGCTQMEKLERLIESRRHQAEVYDAIFRGTQVVPPGLLERSRHVYQSYVVLLPAECADRRSDVMSQLRAGGIEATIGTYHVPMTSFFRKKYRFSSGEFPISDDIAARAISLPLYEGLSEADQRHVADALLRLL